jgi:membrane-associated phospholipid phosphatase
MVAYVLSWLGHPLFILFYVLGWLLAINPYAFGFRHLTDPNAILLLISVFGITILIPGLGVAMMKPLGLIKSLQLPDRQDRTGPYIVAGVFYIWLVKNLMSAGNIPPLFIAFSLGATVSLFLVFIINIFFKVSAHAAGMGGLVCMLFVTNLKWSDYALELNSGDYVLLIGQPLVLAMGFIVAGCVGTARLVLGAHSLSEIVAGYAVGLLSVWIGWLWV